MADGARRTAVVTGASSGIGAATALRLAKEGYFVVAGARRLDRVEDIAARCGGEARQLDVTDPTSVAGFVTGLDRVDVLVNNAGLASGLIPIEDMEEERLQVMWETNVLGLFRMTKALIRPLEASGLGHIVNIGSIAAFETYVGGGGYTATKHAVKALTRTLRKELLGRPIRITEIDPGMVETEFSIVRFDGDAERAAKVYEGMTPLTGEDIADCVAWAVTRPAHVDIDEIVVRPVAQATATMVHRGPLRPRR